MKLDFADGLLSDFSRHLDDDRQRGKVRHGLPTLSHQRVDVLALGFDAFEVFFESV